MIKIKLVFAESSLISLTIEGHAGSGEYGNDLVCAGVSACYCGAVHALDNQFNGIEESHSSGLASLKVKGKITPHDQAVLSVLIEQLSYLRDEKKAYITLEKKGS